MDGDGVTWLSLKSTARAVISIPDNVVQYWAGNVEWRKMTELSREAIGPQAVSLSLLFPLGYIAQWLEADSGIKLLESQAVTQQLYDCSQLLDLPNFQCSHP